MKPASLCLSLVVSSMILAGCGSSTAPNTGATPADEVKTIVANDPSADPGNSGLDGTDAVLENGATFPGNPYAPAINDTCWFRQLQTSTAVLSASGDTTGMTVTLTRTNSGVLNVGDCPNPASAPLFTKNYTAVWTRSGTYTKLAVVDPNTGEENTSAVTRWRLVAATLPHTALNAGDPVIDSVQISQLAGGVSRTFTNPELPEDPTGWPQFALGDSVRVRVYTSAPMPVMAFVHFDVNSGVHPRLQRRRLGFNAIAGAYQGAFVVRHGYFVGRPRGFRVRQALWVDLITRATLRDPAAPYAASGWGVPYRLQRPASPLAALGR